MSPNIRCAKCNKLVDLVEWRDDLESNDRVIRVKCHGATDEMRIDLTRISTSELRQLQLQEGLAFMNEPWVGELP